MGESARFVDLLQVVFVCGSLKRPHKRFGAVLMVNVLHMFQTTVDWEGDTLLCVQRGEKEERGWTHWLEGNTLHLVRNRGFSTLCEK